MTHCGSNQLSRFTARIVLVTTLVAQFTLPWARAEDFQYPELNMVPRNSDRIETEAKREAGRNWGVVLPMLAGSVTTFTAGALSNPGGLAPSVGPFWAGIGVGGVGILASTIIGLTASPYRNAAEDLSHYKGGSLRERLTRERVAEEHISAASRMGWRLAVFSTLLNSGTSVYLFVSATNLPTSDAAQNSSRGVAIVASVVSSAVGLLPLLFRPYWIEVANEQDSYRKRVFAPVAQPTFFPVIDGRGVASVAPGMQLAWRF